MLPRSLAWAPWPTTVPVRLPEGAVAVLAALVALSVWVCAGIWVAVSVTVASPPVWPMV